MSHHQSNQGPVTTTAATLLATALAAGGTTLTHAQSVTLDMDMSDVSTSSSRTPRDYEFGTDLLTGLIVRAHRPGIEAGWSDWMPLTPGAVPTHGDKGLAWVDSHAGAYHETQGYSVHAYLTEEGELAFNFQGFEAAGIEGFEIDLGWFFCFDRTAPDPGTPGSGPGRDITLDHTSRPGYAQSGDLDLSVTYRRPVRNGSGSVVHGDTFAGLYVAIDDDLFQSTDGFGLVTDIDPRFDDPGPRYDLDDAFDWGGYSWLPMYGTSHATPSNGALQICNAGMPIGGAVSLALPADSCYFEMEVHDSWNCWESIDNEGSWYIQASGDSGVPMGFSIATVSGEAICHRDLDIKAPSSFSQLGPDADWFLRIESVGGAVTEIGLSDGWYLAGSLSLHVNASVKSAGIGIKDRGDELTMMNIDFEEAALLEYTQGDGDIASVDSVIGMELRLRNVDHDSARAALGSLGEGIVGLTRSCIGFGDVEITECPGGGTLPQDLNGDGAVDGMDIAEVLASWGACGGCPADFNGDGVVNGGDFALILTAWTG
jgi:hypothetical protein